jgi:hypothetical protein
MQAGKGPFTATVNIQIPYEQGVVYRYVARTAFTHFMQAEARHGLFL